MRRFAWKKLFFCDNLFVFNKDFLITDFKCCALMRDDYAGFILHHADVFKQPFFRRLVKSGCCLVKQDDRCVRQNSARYRKPLNLTLRKSKTLFSDMRIKSVRQFFDKLRRTVDLRRTHDFIICCMRGRRRTAARQLNTF